MLLSKGAVIINWYQGAEEFSDFHALKSCPRPQSPRTANLPLPLEIHTLKFSPPPSFVLNVGALKTIISTSLHMPKT